MSLLRKWFSLIIHFLNKTSDEALDSSIYNCLSLHSFFQLMLWGMPDLIFSLVLEMQELCGIRRLGALEALGLSHSGTNR